MIDLFNNHEKNALMTALVNKAKEDAAEQSSRTSDPVYQFLEDTPRTSLISELVDGLHEIGYEISKRST